MRKKRMYVFWFSYPTSCISFYPLCHSIERWLGLLVVPIFFSGNEAWIWREHIWYSRRCRVSSTPSVLFGTKINYAVLFMASSALYKDFVSIEIANSPQPSFCSLSSSCVDQWWVIDVQKKMQVLFHLFTSSDREPVLPLRLSMLKMDEEEKRLELKLPMNWSYVTLRRLYDVENFQGRIRIMTSWKIIVLEDARFILFRWQILYWPSASFVKIGPGSAF